MKATVVILLFAFGSIDCRKIVQINKNANIDFINMEAGSRGVQPVPAPTPAPAKPASPIQSPTQPKSPTSPTIKPVPVPVPVTQPPKPVQPQQPTPNQGLPTQTDFKPIQPGKPGSAITTPGPGSVKQLVTFYDSQGKASPIRPYSYSQAVKNGK